MLGFGSLRVEFDFVAAEFRSGSVDNDTQIWRTECRV